MKQVKQKNKTKKEKKNNDKRNKQKIKLGIDWLKEISGQDKNNLNWHAGYSFLNFSFSKEKEKRERAKEKQKCCAQVPVLIDAQGDVWLPIYCKYFTLRNLFNLILDVVWLVN